MSFRCFVCAHCGAVGYAFEGEEYRLPHSDNHECEFVKLPPNPLVIHQTDCFMAEPLLDSMNTTVELDRILTREARQRQEDKILDETRRNL